MSQFVRDEANARAIGELYIEKLGPGVSSTGLRHSILMDLAPQLRRRGRDSDAVETGLRKKIRRDFAMGDCVTVDGWIFARTEVQLCILAALKE
jgi:hypothetical protein